MYTTKENHMKDSKSNKRGPNLVLGLGKASMRKWHSIWDLKEEWEGTQWSHHLQSSYYARQLYISL